MRRVLPFFLFSIVCLYAYDYDSGIIDVRSDPRASGGERRFLPNFISVCVDQPPLVIDLNLPPGDYVVDAYLRYYPCEQEHETMDASLGNHTEHIPDMGCFSTTWFYNIGGCGSDCGGDPTPLNFHPTTDSSDLVFQGTGWTTEGVNIIYVRVRGNYDINHIPVVTDLIPNTGEFADNVTVSATSSDEEGPVLSEEYEYSTDGETWLPLTISDDPDAVIDWASELNECEVWLRARAFDGEDYSEWFEAGPILIDNTAPVTTDDAPEGWQNTDITVTLTPDDGECGSAFDGTGTTFYSVDGGEWLEGTEVLLSGTGIYEISYYSVDDVGNTEEIQTATVSIDADCPTFTDWSLPEIDEDHIGTLPVSVTVADEHSGLLGYDLYFAFGETETPEPGTLWEIFTGEIDADWPMHEDEYLYVKAIATDNAGNECESAVLAEFIEHVNHPPIVTALTPTEGEFADDITISAETEDPDGPVAMEQYEYSTDGEIWRPVVNLDTPLLPYVWASGLNECGVYLRVRAYDGELFSEWFEVGPVLIDNTAPVTTDNAPEGWQNTDVTITLTPDDGVCGSGFDGTGTTFYGLEVAFEEGTEVGLTETGIHEFFYYSVDDVGNEEAPHGFTVMIDKECPVFTEWSIPDIDEDHEGALPVSVTVTDEHSGLLEYTTFYAFGTVETPDPLSITWTPFTTEITADWPSHENEYVYVMAQAVDNAGNICDSDIQTEHIEYVNHPPVITALDPVAGEYRDDIVISSESEDPDGPVASVEYGYSTDLETWTAIASHDPLADYAWTSDLNECEVYIRGRAYDGELYSDWMTVGPILIDNTAPVTTHDAPTGWQSEDVTVTLTRDDGVCGSGFDITGTTYYAIDGGDWMEGTEIVLTGSGTYNVQYYSIDDVGNEEGIAGFVVLIDNDCVTFTDWVIPDISGGTGDETCITYTGRDGVHYTVETGVDPTCGLTGIKFENGVPGLGEDGAIEADIFQFEIPTAAIPPVIDVSTKAAGICGYTSFMPYDCAAAIETGGICESGPDEGGFTVQLLDMEDAGDGNTIFTWRVFTGEATDHALSHITFGIMPDIAPSGYYTIGDYEICFGGGIAACDTFTGRDGIDYVVEMGTDPTCGLTGIKFEDGEPGLGEDGAVEADIFQFTVETMPTEIEVSTKAARTCGYTVFSTSTCGIFTGEGGFCEEGPDEGDFIVQLLDISEVPEGYQITFRVMSTPETRHALSHVTFGVDDVLGMSSYSTPGMVIFCEGTAGPSCADFSVTIMDENSGVDADETVFSYAYSVESGISDPEMLEWTPLVTGGEGEISSEICELWASHEGEYIYFLAEGQDIAGNTCYEIQSEYVEPVMIEEPMMESCGRSATFEFPAMYRLHDLIGYNVYRSTSPDAGFERINPEIITTGSFKDDPPAGLWFYQVTKVLATLEEIPFGSIFEMRSYDVVANRLRPTPLPDAQVLLEWNSVPEVNQYHIYGGSPDVDFSRPLATFSAETTWTTPLGLLRPGEPYTFTLVVNSSCGCTDGDVYSTTVNITPQTIVTPGKAFIKTPAPGAKVSGDFLTVSAEPLLRGDLSLRDIRFQIRPEGSYVWEDITPAMPELLSMDSGVNPDRMSPYYININADALGDGRYQIRALSTDGSSVIDSDPVINTFDVERRSSNIDEVDALYAQHLTFSAPPDRIVPVSMGCSGQNLLIDADFMLTGEVPLELKLSRQPMEALPYTPFEPIVAFRTSSVSGLLPEHLAANFTIHYNDNDIRSFVINEEDLRLYTYNGGEWERVTSWQCIETNTITASVEGFGLYVFGTEGLLDVEDSPILPTEKAMLTACPNPFNSAVMISTYLEGKADIAVYSVTGELIRRFDISERGNVSFTWDGTTQDGETVQSGVYLLRVATADQVSIERLILMK